MSTQDGICRYDGHMFRLYDISNTSTIVSNRFSNVCMMKNGLVAFIQEYNAEQFFVVNPDYTLRRDSALTSDRYYADLQPKYFLLDGFPSPIRFSGKLNADSFLTKGDSYEYTLDQGNLCYTANSNEKASPLIEIDDRTTSNPTMVNDIFLIMGKQGIQHPNIQKGLYSFPLHKTIPIAGENMVIDSHWRQGMVMHSDIIVFFRDDIYLCAYKDGQIIKRILFKNFKLSPQFKKSLTQVEFDKASGTLFIGTNEDGLYVLKPKQFQHCSPNGSPVSVNAQVMLDNGNIIDGDNSYNIRKKETSPLGKVDNKAFFKDSDGSIFFSKNNKIYKSDKEFKHFKKMGPLNNPDKKGNQARSFLKDSTGRLWFADMNGFGIVSADSLLFEQRYAFKNDNYIMSLFEKSGDTLWILTKNNIFSYTPKNNRIQVQPLMGNISPRNVYRARDSSIWLGTYGNGFYKYVNGAFIVMPLDERSYLKNAHSFYEDNNGYFWIPTNNGLFQCRKNDLDAFAEGALSRPYYYCYRSNDGFATNEFNGGFTPAYVYSKGGLVYPSLNGVVYFSPDSIKPSLPTNPLFIDQLFVDDKVVGLAGNPLSLPPDFKQLRIKVTSPFWGTYENLIIEYKLDGFHDNWLPATNAENIFYSRLPKGKYILWVRKQAGFGINSFTYKSLSFQVLPYWYETWWSKLLFLMIMVFFIRLFLLIRLRENDRKTAMKAMLAEQKLKALRAQINPHFLHNTFEFLSHQMVTSTREKVIDSMHQISSYIRNVLYRSDESVLSLEDEIGFIEEYLQVQRVLIDIPFRFEIDIAANIDMYEILVPSMLVQPVVENAIKYGLDPDSGENLIRISLKGDGHYISCTVSDTGCSKMCLPKPEGYKSKGFELTLERMRLLYRDTVYEPSVSRSINKHGGWDVQINIPVK